MIFIGGLLGKNKGEVEMANIPLPGVIVHLFYRLTSPLAVLDWKIQNHSGAFLWGDATFNVLKRILYAIGILDTYNMVAFYERNPLTGWTGYVTPSYLIWFYVDFGLIGTFVMPLLLGVVLSIYNFNFVWNMAVVGHLLCNSYIIFNRNCTVYQSVNFTTIACWTVMIQTELDISQN
jgi:hypothetical protein